MLNMELPLQQFRHLVSSKPNQDFLHQPVNGKVTSYSFRDVDQVAKRVAAGLCAQGFEKGDRIAILAGNCAEWMMLDIAIMMAGMISVPIYSTAGSKTIDFILEFSGAKAIFIGKLDSTIAAEDSSKNILSIGLPAATVETDMQWIDWLSEYDPIENVHTPRAAEIFSLLFTSGSTGVPKGVPLSYENIASAVENNIDVYAKGHNRILSYLPMAHIFERAHVAIASFYISTEIFFNESLETFIVDLRRAEVTTFIAVPRLWARFQAQILTVMPNDQLQLQLQSEAGPIVAAKLREQLGFEYCEVFVSGSAPIAPSLLEWYRQLGVNIGEAWGMTETAGGACGNSSPFNPDMLGTIGLPSKNVEMKLSGDGEILIRGACVFESYYNNEEATASSFDDGWFKTGDCAKVEKNGAWRITGRVKEQFKTAKGKYVAPVPIESLLSVNPYIEQICVVGSGMKQPAALVSLISLGNEENHEITQSIAETMEQVNQMLESHKRLERILVVKDAWSVENELLTPTLKLRRNNIEERYLGFLDADSSGIIWECNLSS